MNPDTGQLYPSRQAAIDDGVENPVEIIGRPEDVEAISSIVRSHYDERRRKAKRKAQKASRKANR